MIQVEKKQIEQKACAIYSSYEKLKQKPDPSLIEKLHNFRDNQLKGKVDRQWIINKYYEVSFSISQKNIQETSQLKIANKVIRDYLPQIMENIEQGNIDQSIRLTDKMLDDCIATANANDN
ncbi:MAG: hypothetical protein VX642_04530 [Bdellovibrionota bacterium]|nr:hypothetical protein [Bdellovibrionota bacterium]